MRGEGGVAGSQPMSTAVHGAQINFRDLSPCLTYGLLQITVSPKELFIRLDLDAKTAEVSSHAKSLNWGGHIFVLQSLRLELYCKDA